MMALPLILLSLAT
jgi:hypothetical protein